MLPPEIRKLTPQDAADWWRLRLEALEREPQAFSSAAEDHRQTTVEAVAARIAGSAEGFILGAFREGALVGVAGFHREQELKSRHKGHVWGVYVTAAARGCGIGRELMRALIERARTEPGLEQIVLTVTTDQLAARRLYESLGFVSFGREPCALLVDGRYVDENYYVLKRADVRVESNVERATPMPVRKVFLSSTGADLRTYRDAAYVALHKLDGWRCVRMEDFGPRDCDVKTFCEKAVKGCELFIGIIGHRFGDGPKGTKESFTRREYRAAVEAKLPRLLFLAPDDFPVPANLREPGWKLDAQDAFRSALLNERRILSIGFTSPHELTTQIVTAIRNWERESSGTHAVDPMPYLEALWQETQVIAIRGLKVGNESAHQFNIDQLYTPLTTALAGAERKEGPDERKPVPLQQALRDPRVVLVGDPGAGKSTFLRRIGFAVCETLLGKNALAAEEMLPKPCPFPILIRAASLAEYIRKRKAAPAGEHPAETDAPTWLTHYLESVCRENNWDLAARSRPPRVAGQEEAAGRSRVSDECGERAGFVAARIGIRRVSHRAVSRVPGARGQAPPDFGGSVSRPRGASRADAGFGAPYGRFSVSPLGHGHAQSAAPRWTWQAASWMDRMRRKKLSTISPATTCFRRVSGGLPLGNQTSQFLANVYLNPLDQYVNRVLRPACYIRYVDDFLLFGQSKRELAEMRCAVETFLEPFRLLVHERKSRVYRCADGVTFLGWRLFPEKSRLVRDNVVRFRRRLRQMERAFQEGAATREEIRARIHSWTGHAAAGNTWRLREQLFAQFALVKGSAV